MGLSGLSNWWRKSSPRPRRRVDRRTRQFVVPQTEILEDRLAPAVINEFPIPTPSASSFYITTGPDGALWFTEQNGDKIGRITTAGVVTEFTIPTANAGPEGITTGPDGALWFTEGNASKIGRVTTAGVFSEFTITTGATPQTITTGPDGALWFTETYLSAGQGAKIGRLTTAGAYSEFPVPTFNALNGAMEGITTGPDGALWFTENPAGKIGRVTTAGVFSEFTIPTANAGPEGITTGPDGALWFTEDPAGNIGRITTTGAFSEFAIPTANSHPEGITTGPDGALWFTELGGNQIGRITTAGAFSEFPIPTAGSGPSGITSGPDGALWFNETTSNAIGQLVPAGTGGTGGTGGTSGSANQFYAVGADAGGAPQVNVYNAATNQLVASFYAFTPNFTGGVRVAVDDVNGDGTSDIICAAGPGGGPEVVVIDGTKLTQLQSNGEIASTAIIASFDAFAPTFTGGVFVAAAQSSSGQNWIAASAGASGGPQVVVWTSKAVVAGASAGTPPTPLTSFYAFASTFTGGVSVALGDVLGTGKLDVIAGAGPGGGPQVIVVDGTQFNSIPSTGILPSGALLASFEAFAPGFTGGVWVSGGMIGNQFDLIIGAGPGGGPQVIVVNGSQLPAVQSNGQIAASALVASSDALPAGFEGGVPRRIQRRPQHDPGRHPGSGHPDRSRTRGEPGSEYLEWLVFPVDQCFLRSVERISGRHLYQRLRRR